MSDLVRVRLENGAHASLPEGFAKSHSLPILKQSAVGRDGRALVDKPKTTASEAGSKKNTSGSSTTATTKEETK